MRKPSLSFLLANAVNPVKTFPVVHNKPTWCYPLNAQSERADIQPTYPIDDVNKMRNLHVLFQDVVLKNRNRLVALEVRIYGLCGPYHRFQIALLHSLTMPPFSDLSSSQLLMLMLAGYSSSHQILCFQSCIFISCNALHFHRPLLEKTGFFYSVTSY